jgi:uncharacterized protein (TIGR00159 family)
LDALGDVRPIDALDVALVAVVVWAGLRWLRARARAFLFGLGLLGAASLGARQVGLPLTAWVLQGFLALALIVVVIVFQDDLRRFFEQLGRVALRPAPRRSPAPALDALARSAAQLAGSRRGALIAVQGGDPLSRHLEGGVALDARVSEALLLSLFDPHSPGHDGAVLVTGDRVARFGVHLPLSTDHAQLGSVGTRHAAALGLAERSDALCIVVSEERGSLAVARDGRLRRLAGAEDLAAELHAFQRARGPARAGGGGTRRLRASWPEAVQALALAAFLWLVFVPGASVTRVTRRSSVVVENLPPGFVLEAVEPAEIEVTIAGRRRDVFLTAPDELEVRVDALLAQLGRRTFEISAEQVRHAEGIDVVEVQPPRVRLSLRRAEAGEDS